MWSLLGLGLSQSSQWPVPGLGLALSHTLPPWSRTPVPRHPVWFGARPGLPLCMAPCPLPGAGLGAVFRGQWRHCPVCEALAAPHWPGFSARRVRSSLPSRSDRRCAPWPIALPCPPSHPPEQPKGGVAAHSHGPREWAGPQRHLRGRSRCVAEIFLRFAQPLRCGSRCAPARGQCAPRTAGRQRPRPPPGAERTVAYGCGASSPRGPGGPVSRPASASGQGPPRPPTPWHQERDFAVCAVPSCSALRVPGLGFSALLTSLVCPTCHACVHEMPVPHARGLLCVGLGVGLSGSQVLALCACGRCCEE